jgi:DNA-binding MarR family transcriptional regulator
MDLEKRDAERARDAVRLAGAAAKLIRWLRAADPAPRLTPAQASALAVIVHSDGITPSELAAWEEVKRPTVARTIAQLQALGLVTREPSESDGRAARLRASGKGLAWFREGALRSAQPLAAAMAQLDRTDVDRLTAALPVLEQLIERARH